eukprot:CAMPEP_0171730034 /NCGR_PEP_ID=MMETSP0991-20121206/28014_1 /TAXON_ID=483369 /ORGANISM="non described non described, Strain CCMP2098" /LENGTH=66 /DNA_ID=CAMNT_0012324617 /DNA_START=688 /DNA_END=884 /DNA_ORIENTATION=+
MTRPPPTSAVFPETVHEINSTIAALITRPPPFSPFCAVFPEILHQVIANVAEVVMARPPPSPVVDP